MEIFTLDFDALVERRLERAEMLLRCAVGSDTIAAVLDATSGEFVRVPNQPLGWGALPVALAPDGRTVLFRADRDEDGSRSLCLTTLATGERRWYDADGDDFDVVAAMSPDGRTIATITSGDDPNHSNPEASSIVAVDLIDVATEGRRRLWSTPAETGDSGIHWSPDGRLVAASFVTPDEEYATIVIDVSSGPLRRYNGAQLPISSNGMWLGDREFVYFTLNGFFAADLDHSDRTLPSVGNGLPMAFKEDRIIWVAPLPLDAESAHIVTTNLDGSDPRTLITVRPACNITLIDVAGNTEISRI